MLGRLNPESKDVTIVGAGIAGLLVAYYLDREGFRVSLLEARERAGGLIETRKTRCGLVESAAHSVPATPLIRELCAELGVRLEEIRPEAKARFIYRGGKPRRFPLKLGEILRLFARAYLVLAPRKDPESLNLEEWSRRFLGSPALRYLTTPFVRGIFGSDPSELNISAAFPSLCVPHGHSLLSFLIAKKWRKRPPLAVKRPVPKLSRGPIASPHLGMQELTDALEKHLGAKLGERFRRGAPITEIPRAPNVILCVPAREAAGLLQSDAPQLSKSLSEIRYSPLTTITVFVSRDSLEKEPRGLGMLMPAGEGARCLGVLFNSSAFPSRVNDPGLVSFTVMLDHAPPEPDLSLLVRSELIRLFGLKSDPVELHARSWERAIPRYDSHLLKTWELAERDWCSQPGRILFGNYTGQVSIRGMAELAHTLSRRTV